MLIFLRVMYKDSIEEEDYKAIQEDIAKVVINMILRDDVLKVLVCLLRIDSYDMDKDFRAKYQLLKGIKTSDMGIDHYFSMNDAPLFFKEASKKYGVELKADTSFMSDKSMMNTTLQQELNVQDIANIDFKQYLEEHKQIMDNMPLSARQLIL